MKQPPLLLAAMILFLCGCAHHRAGPSVAGIKSSIGQAGTASGETSRKLSEIRAGSSRIDYKASRALEYFN